MSSEEGRGGALNRTEQNRTEQNRTEQNRTEQNRSSPSLVLHAREMRSARGQSVQRRCQPCMSLRMACPCPYACLCRCDCCLCLHLVDGTIGVRSYRIWSRLVSSGLVSFHLIHDRMGWGGV